MIISFDKISNICNGVDIGTTPLSYSIALDSSIELSKAIQIQDGFKQKENNGHLLYKKPIQTIKKVTVIIGQEETTTVTDKPVLELKNKVNTEGQQLYYDYIDDIVIETINAYKDIIVPLEPAYNENGDLKTIEIKDENGNITETLPIYLKQVGFEKIETTETYISLKEDLQPIYESIQKIDAEGNAVYFQDVTETREVVEDTFIEVEYSKEPIAWKQIEIPKYITVEKTTDIEDEAGNIVKVNTGEFIEIQDGYISVEEETEWVNYEPVMVENIINKQVTIFEEPTYFTIADVLEAKYKNMLNNSECTNIIADCFLNESDIDLSAVEHTANTGYGFIELLPHGVAVTKTIKLDIPVKLFILLELSNSNIDIYINNNKVINNKCVLGNITDQIVIKFVNETDSKQIITSYAIGY